MPTRNIRRVALALLSFGLLYLAAFERIGILRIFPAFHLIVGVLVLLCLSRRPVFSLSLILLLGVAIREISSVKYQFLNMPLYWQDLLYLVRLSTVVDDLGFYGWSLAIPLVFMLAVPAILIPIYRLDRPVLASVNRRWVLSLVALGFVIMDACLLYAGQPLGNTVDSWTVFTKKDAPLTTFLASISSMRVVIPVSLAGTAGGPWMRSASAGLPSRTALTTYTPKVLPDIVVVFEESTFNPRALGECDKVECVSRLFEPDAATVSTGGLLVHIWGGGSWASEFEFLVGLPHSIFGNGGAYAPFTLAPRVRHSLPLYLKQLGYKTITLYPVRRNFIGAYAAYTHYGFDEFYDSANLQLTSDSADEEILEAANRKLSSEKGQRPDRPIFLFTLTRHQHGPHEVPLAALSEPYRTPLFPELPGSVNLNLSNYLDRLHASEQAMVRFENELAMKAKASNRPIVLAHFGDHQPSFGGLIQKMHLSRPPGVEDPRYVTYYMIKRFPPEKASRAEGGKRREILDLAFLAPEILEAAQLPLDDYFAASAQYRDACGGLFECPDRMLQGEYLNYVLGKLQVVR